MCLWLALSVSGTFCLWLCGLMWLQVFWGSDRWRVYTRGFRALQVTKKNLIKSQPCINCTFLEFCYKMWYLTFFRYTLSNDSILSTTMARIVIKHSILSYLKRYWMIKSWSMISKVRDIMSTKKLDIVKVFTLHITSDAELQLTFALDESCPKLITLLCT